MKSLDYPPDNFNRRHSNGSISQCGLMSEFHLKEKEKIQQQSKEQYKKRKNETN